MKPERGGKNKILMVTFDKTFFDIAQCMHAHTRTHARTHARTHTHSTQSTTIYAKPGPEKQMIMILQQKVKYISANQCMDIQFVYCSS